MASAKFLEEALSTDVDESAFSAIVGSLENQLVTSTPAGSNQSGNSTVLNQNHINSAISNGGTVPSQKHGAIANGDTINTITGSAAQVAASALQNSQTVTNYATLTNADSIKVSDGVNVYSQPNQVMPSGGAIISNRVTFPSQNLPNGTIGLSQIAPQTVLQTATSNSQTIQGKQPTLVIKTSSAPGAQGLVTVPMNVTASVPQVNNVGSPTTQTSNILPNLQVLNVRPGVPTQPQKGQQARVVLSAPQLVGARPGTPAAATTPNPTTIAAQVTAAATPTVATSTPVQKSLPLLRHSLATKELTIDGIRPPPSNVVFSIASGTPTIQTQARPAIATSQVRLVAPGTTVMRPGIIQQRLVTPIRAGVQQTRMVTAIRQPNASQPVIVSNSQPPALHPVYPSNQVRPGVNIIRQPIPVRTGTPGQIRPQMTVRTTNPVLAKNMVTSVKTTGAKPIVPSNVSKLATKDKEKKSFSAAYTGDDDINDVAAMGGVNLAEETQRILGSTEFVGTQIRSCKEEFFLCMGPLQHRIRQAMLKHGFDEPSNEVPAIISHAAQERLKNLVEKLAIITEHRLELVKSDSRYEVTSDIKGQLKFLEEVDRAERKKHEELEREILLRAAKSRSKTEDPEQAKLKAKAKEMQRVEMEELRQREANATALQAIGPRKKPKLDSDVNATTSQPNNGLTSGARGQLPLKQRMKKVTLRDLQFLFETEKELCKSTLLFKSYLK